MKSLSIALVSLTLLLVASLVQAAPRRRPAPSDEPAEKTHVVAPGQTIGKIAKRYRVSIQDLREANDLSPGTPLKPGTRLVIPSEDVPTDRARKGQSARTDKADKADKGPKHRAKAGQDGDDRDEEEPRHGRRKKAKESDEDTDTRGSDGAEPGHVRLVRGDRSWEGKVLLGKGSKVTPESSRAFARLLSADDSKPHSIDAKLIALIARVSDHFGGRPIEVVSGFRPRSPSQATAHSKHNSGSAVDFHIAGVPIEEIRDFARTLGKVGVGYYPNSGFIHLDVRPAAFAWTDTSGPGESPRYTHDEPAKGEDKKEEPGKDEKRHARAR